MSADGPYRNGQHPLVERLAEALGPKKFKPRECPPQLAGAKVLGLLVKKTFNFNIAICVLALPEGETAGPLAQKLKRPIADAAGHFVFFYTLGLQVVFVGETDESQEDIHRFVDPMNDPVCVLQSIHVHRPGRAPISTRTWGQVFTGGIQDEIERVLVQAEGL